MKSFTPLGLVSSLLLASSALAQRYTTTLPFVDGDTLVLSVTTRLGVAQTVTISTVNGVGAPLTTPTTTTNTQTRNTATTATGPDTTFGRIVGQDTSYEPMRTTTYFYDPGNGGEWQQATWTASVTELPTVPTAIVPEGTKADYDAYQSSINSLAFQSATRNENAVQTGAAAKRVALNKGIAAEAGWAGLAIGAVGAGVGLVGF